MKTLGKFVKSTTNETWISLSDYKGKPLIDVRDYFKTTSMAEWQPTKRGVTFSINMIPELVSTFERIEDELNKGEASG